MEWPTHFVFFCIYVVIEGSKKAFRFNSLCRKYFFLGFIKLTLFKCDN